MAKRKVGSQIMPFLITKSQESPWFSCVKMTCNILLEKSWRELQLCFRFHFNRKLAQRVMGLQSCKSLNFKNFETLNLGVPRQNDIWVQAPWPSTKNTIRGKVVVSPNFGPWWIFWSHICPWFVCVPKVLQLCINQLVVWFA
jgi:hypothetical protein